MDTVVGICTQCGAENVGTRFCEHCGAPAATGVATPMAITPSPPVSAPARVGATGVRVWTLVFFLLAETVPGFLEFSQSSSGNYLPELHRGSTAVLVGTTGLFAVIAALAGRAGGTGKAFGALFALTYVGVTLFLLYGSLYTLPVSAITVFVGLAYVSLYLSWALGRPFRGRGYLGLLVFVVVDVLVGLLPYIPGLYGTYLAVLLINAVVTGISVWIIVGLSVLLERRRAT